MYPTGPKMIAGLCFAGLAFLVTGMVIPNIPYGNPTLAFGVTNAAIGFLVGWRLVGRRAGEGYAFGVTYGITAAVLIVFWCLLFWAGREMLERSLDLYYSDPTEALEEMIRLMVDFSTYLLGNNVLPTLAIGAMFCGALTELVAQKTAHRLD
ncbi:TrgA family protein [Oceaniglobus indicus]|uniref:TrgA family protein n=1 Tax=Oceaniglobus indicus TaxID=2047749 RepID=UPI000C1932FB|nr:TrgA family protein [Oceaniglobus indicus]